jgi:hypothetical protein
MSQEDAAKNDAAPKPALVAPARRKRARRSRTQFKSDGLDHAQPVAAAPQNTPGAQNAALKEPRLPTDQHIDLQHACRGIVRVLDADLGLVSETAPDGSPRRKIAICGFASSTRKYIPVDDKSWSVWGLNQLYRHIPRADRWFDIHHNWDKETVPGTDHFGWARDCGMPFYMLQRQPELPTSVTYPIAAILKHFEADYFTSTIAYMVALAVWEIDARVAEELRAHVRRATKNELACADIPAVLKQLYAQYTIGLFGIDLTVGEEYFHEKPCAEYWLGQASRSGIQVAIPPESALCKQRFRYGYERSPESLVKVAEIAEHKATLQAQRDEMFKRLMMLEGAIECDERWKQLAELRERGTAVE